MAPKTTDRSGDSIYAYETKQGTRYRFVYRDAGGKQSQKRGFTSRTAARKERERLVGRVHRGEVRILRETFGDYWERYLARRRPYLEAGTWNAYRSDGKNRLLPAFADTKLTACAPPTASVAARAKRS